MNLNNRVRRAVVAVALASSVATAIGAAGAAQADTDVPADPPTTEVPPAPPAEESPPAEEAPPGPEPGSTETPPAADDDTAAPSTTTPPAPTDPTTPPASTEPAEVPPTTDAAETTVPAQSGKPVSTTPQSAIATPTTTTPNEAIATLASATAATAPQSPKPTPGNASVKLTWLAPSSNGGAAVDYYGVQRSTNGTSWVNAGSPAGTAINVGGLSNGTKYYFRIRAHNSAGFGPFSTVVAAVPRKVPTAPLAPKATPGNHTVKLTWSAPSSNGGATINQYRVQRLVSGVWKNVASPTVRSYQVTNLTNGIKYSFRILAHNAAGWGPASTVTSAVPRTKPTAPRSPAAIPGNGTVLLTWLAPSSNGGAKVDKYEVQWAYSAAGPWFHVDDTIGTSYTVMGINNGVANNFRILAHNAAGWSAPSTVVDTPVFLGVPGAPQACSASQVGNFGTHSMWLDWQPPLTDGGSAITGYLVELNGPLSLGVSLPPSPLQYKRDNLPPGYYVVRVATVSLVGKSPWCTDGVVIN